jgi:hypothetical protein
VDAVTAAEAPAWADLAVRTLEVVVWPAVAALALVLFRRQIRDVVGQLASRLRRAQFPGGALDFELEAALHKGVEAPAERTLDGSPASENDREKRRLETHAFRMEALQRTPDPTSVADLKMWLEEASSPSIATWGAYVAVLHLAEGVLHFLGGGSWSLYWRVRQAAEDGLLPPDAIAWARAVNASGLKAFEERDLSRDDATRAMKLVFRLATVLQAVPLPEDSESRPPPPEELASDELDQLD